MGNTLRETLDGTADWQSNVQRRKLQKYGGYFGGGGSGRSQNPDSGSQAGATGNVEPRRETEDLDQGSSRYWRSRVTRFPNAGNIATEQLNKMDRSEIPASGASGVTGDAGRATGTTATTQGVNRGNALYLGGNEGALPTLSFGKTPPRGFYDDPPAWVMDDEKYQETLQQFGTVQRRRDQELDTPDAGEQALQEVLTGAGYDTGGVDGFWGRKTDAALRQFKNDNKLGDNLDLDEKTIEALRTSASELRGGNISNRDRGLLN